MDTDNEDVLHMKSRFKEAVGVRATDTLLAHLAPDGWAAIARIEHVDAAAADVRAGLEQLRRDVSTQIRRQTAWVAGFMGTLSVAVAVSVVVALVR